MGHVSSENDATVGPAPGAVPRGAEKQRQSGSRNGGGDFWIHILNPMEESRAAAMG